MWEASARLARGNGHAPDSTELAHELGVTRQEIEESQAANQCFAPSSLDHQPSTQDHKTVAPLDYLGEVDHGYDRAEAVAALRPLCRRLGERDRRILYLRFFHEWTQAKIAAELGVTQMQVSRLLTRILGQLRADLGQASETDLAS